jgi:hypothetical protein
MLVFDLLIACVTHVAGRLRNWWYSIPFRRVGRVGPAPEDVPELAPDVLRATIDFLPLRRLAQLAHLSTEFSDACFARVAERNRVVAGFLASQFTDEFREGLHPSQTRLPRDLVVDPPVRSDSACSTTRFFRVCVWSGCSHGNFSVHICEHPTPYKLRERQYARLILW